MSSSTLMIEQQTTRKWGIKHSGTERKQSPLLPRIEFLLIGLKILIESEGKHYIDLPIVDWTEHFSLAGNQAYIVNAFYDPTKNNIYLPICVYF